MSFTKLYIGIGPGVLQCTPAIASYFHQIVMSFNKKFQIAHFKQWVFNCSTVSVCLKTDFMSSENYYYYNQILVWRFLSSLQIKVYFIWIYSILFILLVTQLSTLVVLLILSYWWIEIVYSFLAKTIDLDLNLLLIRDISLRVF